MGKSAPGALYNYEFTHVWSIIVSVVSVTRAGDAMTWSSWRDGSGWPQQQSPSLDWVLYKCFQNEEYVKFLMADEEK